MQGGARVTERLPRAILFDLDDTILSASAHRLAIMSDVATRHAPSLSDVSADDLLAALRDGANAFWADPTRQREGRLDPHEATRAIAKIALEGLGATDAAALAASIAHDYMTEQDASLEPFPGAIETLEKLRGKGVRLALITNGGAEGQRGKVVRFGLERYFECIVIEGEFGVGKPDERVYRHALATLATEPEDAWMVGDNLEWEVATPQRLGLRGIWVDWAGIGLPEEMGVRPDRIVRAISELV